jgi:MoxR-like ATPase
MGDGHIPPVEVVVRPEDIAHAREVVSQIYIDDKIKEYIINLVFATREPKEYGLDSLASFIEYGASPRATLYLAQAARAHAFLRRRGHVIPDDVKSVGLDVLRHRIILTYEAEAEELKSDDIVRQVFDNIEAP